VFVFACICEDSMWRLSDVVARRHASQKAATLHLQSSLQSSLQFHPTMSTRRKPLTTQDTALEPTPPSNQTSPSKRSMSQRATTLAAFLPTPLEALLLLIYPTTLLLGSLSTALNPAINWAHYNASQQSFAAAHAPSYFARKTNAVNVYFVKAGWLWTSLALAAFAASHRGVGTPPLGFSRRRAALALRWLLASAVWFLVTQWCFGPALIDRGFRWSGGVCEREGGREADGEVDIVTHAACRLVGGQWKGGHDISGHVFLLILGSALLCFEVLPVVLRAKGWDGERVVRTADGRIVTVAEERRDGGDGKPVGKEEEVFASIGTKFAIGIVALSWWMLLMTAAFFHTWFEKLTGLIVAFIGIWLVYFLPRGVPVLRAVLGMPGV